jgi:hypothetical protein
MGIIKSKMIQQNAIKKKETQIMEGIKRER